MLLGTLRGWRSFLTAHSPLDICCTVEAFPPNCSAILCTPGLPGALRASWIRSRVLGFSGGRPSGVGVAVEIRLNHKPNNRMRNRDLHDDPPTRRREPYRGPPVTLGHIRLHGVCRLLIYYSTGLHHHGALVDDRFGRTTPYFWTWIRKRSAPNAE
jgi:hypothetical protein